MRLWGAFYSEALTLWMGYECHKYRLRPYASNLMLQFLTYLTCAKINLFEGLGMLCQRWKHVYMLCIHFALAGIQVLTAQSRLIPASCATFAHLPIQPSPAPLWNMVDSVDAIGTTLARAGLCLVFLVTICQVVT